MVKICTLMTAERWKRIDEVYHLALDCAPLQRAAFIAEACNCDEDLRKEIHDLVERHESAKGHLLDHPAWKVTSEPNDAETIAAGLIAAPMPGTRLGPYEIAAQIRAGGMGQG